MKALRYNSFMVLWFLFVLVVHEASPEILFHDNFDSQADWRTIGTSSSKDIDGYSGSGEQAGCPTGWDFWRVDEAWTPENTTGTNPSVQITATNRLGSSGKSLVITNESHEGSAGDGWGSDGFLAKYLGASGYHEIFLRYKIKTQPGFKRHWDTIMQSAMKTARIVRYEGPGSVFSFFSGGYTAPGLIEDMCESNYGGFTNMASRCDPQETDYACGQYGTVSRFKTPGTCTNVTGWLNQDQVVGTDDSAVGIWDSGEHTVIMHVKMNSAPGVADGVYEYYYDGCLSSSRSDIPWVAIGGSVVQGWNNIGLGGNARNNHAGITNWPPTYQAGAEQWYAFDDVVIATTLQEAIDGVSTCGLFYQAPTGDGLSGVGNGESRNAYRGMYWTGESITTCSGSVRLHPVGNIDNIDYEVAVWSVDVADNLSLDTKLASVTISGADIVDGWNDFTLNTPVLMSSGNTVIIISRTDPSTLDGSNYIMVYNGYDETDTESRQWNIHYEPDGTMAGRSPGDEDQPEYFTCDWRLNSYLTTSSSSRPNIPEDISVAVNSGTSILVSWVNRDNSGVTIDHYNVYTYNLTTAVKTKVGETETTSFVHSNLQTGVYTYVVTAVSSTGAESYHSLDNADAWTISFTAGTTYDAPTITGPVDSSTTNTSIEIEGMYAVDPDLPDQAVTVTWALGGNSGFAVAALGVFSCTVPVELGANSTVFEITDSNSATASDTTVITRTAPPSATSRGVTIQGVQWNQ